MPNVFVGIDVSKEWFDIAVRRTGAAWRAAQDEAGITQLVKQLCNPHPRLVVLEATGGYETPLVVAQGTADVPVAVVNSRQIRRLGPMPGEAGQDGPPRRGGDRTVR